MNPCPCSEEPSPIGCSVLQWRPPGESKLIFYNILGYSRNKIKSEYDMLTFYHIPKTRSLQLEQRKTWGHFRSESLFRPGLPQQLVHLPPLPLQLFHHGSCKHMTVTQPLFPFNQSSSSEKAIPAHN